MMKRKSERKYDRANVTWLNKYDKYESNVVYLLTFNDNGEEMYYVGRTTTQLRERIQSHSPIIPDSTLLVKQAIYRLKHFSVSILCKCIDKDELKVKEEYYTLQYRSNEREFGYNVSVGDIQTKEHKIKNSKNSKSRRPVLDVDTGVVYRSITEASKALDIPFDLITYIACVGRRLKRDKDNRGKGKLFIYQDINSN